MEDELEDKEELVLEFEDDYDEEEELPKSRSRAQRQESLELDPKIQAKVELANERVKLLEEKLSSYDKLFSENEEVEKFRQLEDEFSDVDDRTKLYQKRLIAKQNEKIASVLKGLKSELDALKENVKQEELLSKKIQEDLLHLNDTIILQNVARKALERELPDIVFINPKTKKKIPLGQSHVDQALKVYTEKVEEDPRFKKQVEDLLNSTSLTPLQKQNRIGKFIVNVFNERIEAELASKKAKKPTTTEEPAKKAEPKPEAKSSNEKPAQKELTEEEKKALDERNREAIRRSLAKSL